MPNSKPKRRRPQSRKDRARLCEVNRLLNKRNLAADERTNLEAERDELSPVVEPAVGSCSDTGTPIAKSIPSAEEVPEKPAANVIPFPDRVDGRGNDETSAEELPNVDWRVHVPGLKAEAPLARRCVILAADFQVRTGSARECFASAERMHELFLTGEFTLADLDTIEAAFMRNFGTLPESAILPPRSECKETVFAVLQKKALAFFRSRSPEERARLRRVFGNGPLTPQMRAIVDTLKARVVAPVLEEKAAAPGNGSAAVDVSPVPKGNPESVIGRSADAPQLSPFEHAALDLRSRAELVLTTDSWLQNLATHNLGTMREKILTAITERLLTVGHADGLFCLGLYNELRPRGVAKFPERRF